MGDFFFLFIFLISAVITYRYIELFNEEVILFIRLGPLLLLSLCLMISLLTFRFFIDFRYEIKRVKKEYKLVLITSLLLISSIAYPVISQTFRKIEYSNFNPLINSNAKIAEEWGELLNHGPGFNSKTYDIETKVFKIVNQERQSHGLNELVWDPWLADVARQHSLDMANKSYFSHDNLKGEDPSERAKDRGINIVKEEGIILHIGVGENIGKIPKGYVSGYGYLGTNEKVAVTIMDGWMKNPGHRSNILDPNYEFIGVGVADDGYYRYYLTQDFK